MVDKYKKAIIPGKEITIYAAGKRVATALQELSELDLYKGAKMIDLIATAYAQGKKDGAAEVKQQIEGVTKKIPNSKPGRPKKKK